jgi:hypothetical protein
MGLSLNQSDDDSLIELAKEARKIGATVSIVTSENTDNVTEANRTITITYQTHSTNARALTKPRRP